MENLQKDTLCGNMKHSSVALGILNSRADVIAVVHELGPIGEIVSRTTNKPVRCTRFAIAN